MVNKTSDAKLAANDRYEAKNTRKNVIFKSIDDEDLLSAIASDDEDFSPLVKRLLRAHYNL